MQPMQAQISTLSEAQGLVSLLSERNSALQIHALQKLVEIVDTSWHIVAENITAIETLQEDEEFPESKLAAFLAAKVYFHLEEIDTSCTYALLSGEFFSPDEESEFSQTIISEVIDKYIQSRTEKGEGNDPEEKEYEKIFENMLNKCLEEGYSRQALGVALEAHRLDFVDKALTQEGCSDEILSHTFHLCETVVQHKGFRTTVFNLLLTKYEKILQETGSADYRNVCRCLYYLGNAKAIADILRELLEKDLIMAYQTAFDLTEYEDSSFLSVVVDLMYPKRLLAQEQQRKEKEMEGAEPPAAGAADAPAGDAPAAAPAAAAEEDAGMEPEKAPVEVITWDFDPTLPQNKIVQILNGTFSELRYLHILCSRSKHDFVILKQIKDKVPMSISSLNMAVAAANAIMCSGTTIDNFLRDNLEWMSKFRNFNKFISVALMGVIHKGHFQDSRKVLGAYLPGQGNSNTGGPIANGGALYALGLVHTDNCDHDTRNYLFEWIDKSKVNEVMQHGAILGNALINIASQNMSLYSECESIFSAGSAVPGSAAGYAAGLVMAGSMNPQALEDLKQYASEDTGKKSEKVVRSVCMALAMCCYAREEQADSLIMEMKSHRDFHVRYGACYAIGLAYACTANNRALRWLLDMAVSDVSDDVRRAATTSIGFVFANKPEQVPEVLRLLAKSYNPFVRYGAAAAIGIACAGTANKKAAKLLKALRKDNVEYVRQSANISSGILYMERNDIECPEVKTLKEEFSKTIDTKRRADKMGRMGAILGSGLLAAGGRNLTISMVTPGGQKRMKAILGMMLFWQHWEWYPFIPMISLCFTPTFAIGLNEDLNLPKFDFHCNCKPSLFAYPPKLTIEKAKQPKLLKKAELSITAKAKARQAKKAKEKAQAEDELKDKDEEMEDTTQDKEKMEVDEKEGDKEEEKEADAKPEPEPESYSLANPCRVTAAQQKFVSLPADCRYELVNDRILNGFIMLRDKTPDDPKELVELGETSTAGVYGNEPDPPADFHYTGV